MCNSKIVSLDDTRDYEALSYAWGDPKVARPIQLQGIQLPVTTNFESALRHLRHRSTKRVLWIDAICINQAFKKERNHQVELMKFKCCDASVVRVWLGEESDGSLSTMKILGEFCGETSLGEIKRNHRKPLKKKKQVEGLIRLLERP